MSIMIAIFGAIFAIFSVVIIHEFGHFIVARCVGVKVLRFSIGFGKPLWSKTTKKGTEFAIAWLPLGGYVRMLGEGDDASPQQMNALSYSNKSVFQRMAIIVAGPLLNFLLAVVLYWILFLPGVVHIKPVIGQVKPNSVAAHAGLQPMDQITAINNKPVQNWRDIIMVMIANTGNKKTLSITVSHPPAEWVRNVQLPVENWKIDEQKPQFLQALGIVPYHPKFPLTVGNVQPSSPAAQGGLQQGDRILTVNGKSYDDMLSIIELIRQYPNESVRFVVMRNNQQKIINVRVGEKKEGNKSVGYLGFYVTPPVWPSSMLQRERYSLLTAWKPAALQTALLIKFNGIMLGKMILGKVSLKTLGGPISIFQMAGQASQQNYRVYLGFVAFLSIALGFINLLPIPGLDGGHFLFQVIELIFRRPVPVSVQVLCLRIGLILLIFLILNATFNDVRRLFG